ncbi:Nramp family divalent metal transporter [Thiomicrorhabdus sp. 6S2-11]|uniref:Nramp family divalent metal transporter n=1 Tax=Thiomicrorhabdus marina TaxID=2818442 RepID=A0ABS3Q3C0_9GAMM|nr:Nramp family divalent metal transporter [Thiomicrorhabdus marina]MBO1926832.1 Nramp family divalent metal transporter [Thiomicrorhabdus marina]
MASKLLNIIVPGLLIAATGVGAGDLATAAFAGGNLGIAILWAVVLGGLFKFALTEGIARWQLVNGDSFIDGLAKQLGLPFIWIFLIYLVLWSFFVGSALISASGVAMHSLIPIFEPQNGKIIFGILLSLVGLALVRFGNFALFEKVMGISIGIMFFVVVLTALLLWPGMGPFLNGLFIPSIPNLEGNGLTWTVALVGGVGGTLTIFSYGYWIREKQRISASDISVCRIDLLVGYSVTVIFGMAMVIIGSTVPVDGKGTGLILNLANGLENELGTTGRWLFLFGAFFAIFSSLLGVWQAVPYLFADVVRHIKPQINSEDLQNLSQTLSYKGFQIALAIIPMLSLWISFKEVQKLYAIVGTLFMPFLALALLYFNNRTGMKANKSGWFINTLLLITLIFFSYIAWQKFIG